MARRPDVTRRIAAVESAVRAAIDAIKAEPDSQSAIEQAAALRERLSALEGEVAQLRAEVAHRIWSTERVSLAQLASRMGVSTARAGQLVQTGKPPTEEQQP
jgi:hypothetical protein